MIQAHLMAGETSRYRRYHHLSFLNDTSQQQRGSVDIRSSCPVWSTTDGWTLHNRLQSNCCRDTTRSWSGQPVSANYDRMAERLTCLPTSTSTQHSWTNSWSVTIWSGQWGLILRGARADILACIHSSHIDMKGCIQRARKAVFWPGMMKDIQHLVACCEVCKKHQSANDSIEQIPVGTALPPLSMRNDRPSRLVSPPHSNTDLHRLASAAVTPPEIIKPASCNQIKPDVTKCCNRRVIKRSSYQDWEHGTLKR